MTVLPTSTVSATVDAAKLEQGDVDHLLNQGVDAAQVFEDQGDFYGISDDDEGGDAGITMSENSRLEWGSRNYSRELVQTGMYFSSLQILLRSIRSSSLIYHIGSSK